METRTTRIALRAWAVLVVGFLHLPIVILLARHERDRGLGVGGTGLSGTGLPGPGGSSEPGGTEREDDQTQRPMQRGVRSA